MSKIFSSHPFSKKKTQTSTLDPALRPQHPQPCQPRGPLVRNLRQDLEGRHHIEMVLQELRHGAVGLLALLGQLHREVLGTTQASNERQVKARAIVGEVTLNTSYFLRK